MSDFVLIFSLLDCWPFGGSALVLVCVSEERKKNIVKLVIYRQLNFSEKSDFWPLGVGQNEVYNNSKWIVLTYFSTAILELAYHNRPFVLILDSRINYSCSVSKTIEDFLELGIVHYEIDSLLNFLNKTNINDWFYSIKTQKVINQFKMNYVWISNDKKFDIKKIL